MPPIVAKRRFRFSIARPPTTGPIVLAVCMGEELQGIPEARLVDQLARRNATPRPPTPPVNTTRPHTTNVVPRRNATPGPSNLPRQYMLDSVARRNATPSFSNLPVIPRPQHVVDTLPDFKNRPLE
ncbi:hypothetical protein PC9H_010317 [Pleurotus ostreatus]|uniref:Uncharacterized protein n=1 Tax=Pleurotus ostreatus TaxID=5322 RepID=A0A8H7DSX7_PLEOS|nr:uncharacterized protein PC9H_010317 [Pleurotus ostreatus]KAF7425006.1 hypothetical protein PC9H_010317 [Pleurotus ostreatus]